MSNLHYSKIQEASSESDDVVWNDIKLAGSERTLYCNGTPCESCGKVFSSEWNMEKHHKSMQSWIRYLCNQCDYAASSEQTLEDHMKRARPPMSVRGTEDILTCSECGKVTNMKFCLTRPSEDSLGGLSDVGSSSLESPVKF